MNNESNIKYAKELIEKNKKRNETLMLKIKLLEEINKERECIICGKKFKPKRINSIFCSTKCAKKGYELIGRDLKKSRKYAKEYAK